MFFFVSSGDRKPLGAPWQPAPKQKQRRDEDEIEGPGFDSDEDRLNGSQHSINRLPKYEEFLG